MRKHSASFAPIAATVVFAAAIATTPHSRALAESECLETPSQQSINGAHWYYRSDRATGRKCWYLANSSTSARDAATPQGQANAAATQTLSSRLATLFGGLTSSPAAVPPQNNATSEPRTLQSNATHAPKTERGVRADQPDAPPDTAEKRAGKSDLASLTQAKRNALFEEFLRWHESQHAASR